MTIAAVITAAGQGTRLGSALPKALVPINGRALVAHAVDRVASVASIIVVTAPAGFREQVSDAVAGGAVSVTVVDGSVTRQASVAAGLAALAAQGVGGDDIVLIHDAARAFMPAAAMLAAVDAVQAGAEGAVPVLRVVDTLVAVDGDAYGAIADRASLRAVQTPQVFRARVIADAHSRAVFANPGAVGADAPDDASLAVAAGYRVVTTTGHAWGAKVTHEGDLALAAYLAEQ